ncbi:MAG: hypothetical protein HY578_06135 [Nitrospinae bacterium]|nr:hypothetical protein [Nitrospinota bacterium]
MTNRDRQQGFSFAEGKRIDFTYDKNGNLVKRAELDDGQIKRTTLYTYDYENRLIKVVKQENSTLTSTSTLTLSFTYDPFGRRLSKSVHRPVPESFNQGEEIEDDNEDGHDDRDNEDKETPKATYYVYDNEDIILEYLLRTPNSKLFGMCMDWV